MKFSNSIAGLDWLRQFDVRDVHVARMLLDSLKLVSFSECERAISDGVGFIINQTSGPLALVTADKKLIDSSSSLPGSEARLGHLFQNLQRQHEGRILIRPTIVEMRHSRVEEIVIVDDFVCSGQRIEDYWDVWTATDVPLTRIRKGKTVHITRKRGSIRSWLSYGYCRLWLVGYAVHETGLARLLKRIPYLRPEQTRFELTLKAKAEYWQPEVTEMIQRSDELYGVQNSGFGWGNQNIPLVFQHGCPDNCPKILWENNLKYRAFFPNRAVPTTLFPCFEGVKEDGRGPSLLAHAGQNRLAQALIQEMKHARKSSDYLDILTVLGLILSGRKVENLAALLLREESQVRHLLDVAKELSLLSEEYDITPFGRDIIGRSRQSFLTGIETVQDDSSSPAWYIPMQYQKQICGAQRKSRNDPDTKP